MRQIRNEWLPKVNDKVRRIGGKRIAYVECVVSNIAKGAVRLDRELEDCKYWNTDSLVLLKRGRDEKNEIHHIRI